MPIPDLDIVLPVYNEGRGILPVLRSLKDHVRTPFRVLLCYDFEEDDTLPAVRAFQEGSAGQDFPIVLVKNPARGPHSAILEGFRRSEAPAVLVWPADDVTNAAQVDLMMGKFREGHDIVAACRFMPGGTMQGCPWLKDLLVRCAASSLHRLAGVPSRDASNGLRLFSRRVLREIPIESSRGFTYSIELLVKAHRRRWRVADVPFRWIERTDGKSRFRVGAWLLAYLRWYVYAFGTRLGLRA